MRQCGKYSAEPIRILTSATQQHPTQRISNLAQSSALPAGFPVGLTLFVLPLSADGSTDIKLFDISADDFDNEWRDDECGRLGRAR